MNFTSKILIFIILFGFSFSIDEQKNSNQNKNTSLIKKLSLVPGLGQIYNGKPFKGGFFAFSQFYFLSQINSVSNVALRNSYSWASLFIYLLNIIDAQVDFELSTFPDEEKLNDLGDE